jgi:2-polyprenyl-6-methoxyphenol hydroxylase-like FAD-dependent oxidoreductase
MTERISDQYRLMGAAVGDVPAALEGIDLEGDPVLIVGAGPVGMTAALALAFYGIRSIILDDDNKLSYGSRALAIHRSALEVWEKLECVAPMLARGFAWQARHTYFRDTHLFTQQMLPLAPDVLPTFLNLQQSVTEAILLDSIRETSLIEVRWLHRVVGLRQEGRRVVLEVRTTHGADEIAGGYVLGCDGARSAVRDLLNMPFPGSSHADRFLIADIRADLPFPREPRFFFDPPSNPGRTLLIHPQPDNVWRIDWQLAATVDMDLELRTDILDNRIRSVIGPDVAYEVVWVSHYRFQQRLVPRFREGRVFLLGDAAHLVAPFGARGMNSGIADAENLCWKLHLVLTGQAPDALLDTYQTERWAAQQHNQVVTQETMRFMVPPTPAHLRRRTLLLRASRYLSTLRRHVNSGKMVGPYTYSDSPLLVPDLPAETRAWPAAPALGARVPDAPCTVVGNAGPRSTRLRHLLGVQMSALYFVRDGTDIPPVLDGFRAAQIFPVALYLVVAPAMLAALPPRPPGVRVLVDTTGALATAFAARPGSFYLLRPDCHLAARRRVFDPATFATLVNTALGAPRALVVPTPARPARQRAAVFTRLRQ